VYVYVCVCVYIYICVYVYVCMYIYVCVCVVDGHGGDVTTCVVCVCD